MTKYPNDIDDDVTLPSVINSVTENGQEAINALKYAILAMQTELGIKPSGVMSSLAERLNVSFNTDGTLKSSVVNSLGVAILPIYNSHVAPSAAIDESKLNLNYPTSTLNTKISALETQADASTSWIFLSGQKLNPHINGTNYFHNLSHILVSTLTSGFFKNKFTLNRNNSNAYTALKDLNDDFVDHQLSDSSGSSTTVVSKNGTSFPSSYAHVSAGVFVDTTRFGYIPQTNKSLQSVLEFLDNSSIFLYGTRIQNLYSNGISRVSRSSVLNLDGYNQILIKDCQATAFLRNTGLASYPTDDINNGDDIIKLTPSGTILSSNKFDSQFKLVKAGDIAKINYNGIEVNRVIKEVKYLQSGLNKTFIIRIDGKNLSYTTSASVTISKSLVNDNKFGALAVTGIHNDFSEKPTLSVISSRNAMVAGISFVPDLINSTNYNLYLALYPTGNPSDGYVVMPPVDITGDLGVSSGSYTLESIVQTTNDSFRKSGYNLRFQAFSNKGEFGIAMTDSIDNAAFSIISGVVDNNGFYDQTASETNYPNNVVGLFDSGNILAKDPLGFGPRKANVASPLPLNSYSSVEQALIPTKLFTPLTRNNFYVNAVELDRLSKDIDQINDTYGDGYWNAEIISATTTPGVRVETKYRVYQDLSTSKLEVGKVLTVQKKTLGSTVDFGRYIISNVDYSNCNSLGYSEITVYDSVHANGSSPSSTLTSGFVRLYFGDDSIGFNSENASDNLNVSPFKRFFEVYVDEFGKTFTHEKARMYTGVGSITVNGQTLTGNSNVSLVDICYVSPKFKGFSYGSIRKTKLIAALNSTTGFVSAYLAPNAYPTLSNSGPITSGRIGEKIKVYDQSNVDYIEIIFKNSNTYSSFTLQAIDIQTFDSLSNDHQLMQIATCQLNDSTNKVEYLKDTRDFGNTSEKDLTTSALDFISATARFTNLNGVLQGFELQQESTNPNLGQIKLKGGSALIDGKIVQKDADSIVIPLIKESAIPTALDITWAVCLDSSGDLVCFPTIEKGSERVVTVINLVSSTTYKLTAYTFDQIVNKKNLCILYLVKSAITPPSNTQTLLIKDAKRIAKHSDSSGFAKYTSNSFGNHKTASALFEWMSKASEVTSAKLGGCFETITNDFDFGNSSVIKEYDGEKNTTITITNPVGFGAPTIGLKSKVTLKGLNLNFENANIAVLAGASDITIEDCVISFGTSLASSYSLGERIFEFKNGSNIKLINNTFVFNIHDVGDTSVDNGAAIRFENCSKVKVVGNTITSTYYNTLSRGSALEFISTEAECDKNTVTTNASHAVKFVDTNKLSISDNTFNLSYNPLSSGDEYYSASDFINYKIGYVKGICSTQLSSIKINGNSFVYTNESGSYLDRSSFVVLEMSSLSSYIKNCFINENVFKNTNATSSNLNGLDFKGIVAVINSYVPSLLDEAKLNTVKPRIQNLEISKNISDYGTIVVTSLSKLNANLEEYIPNPGLVVDGCISENSCGNIGYWTASLNSDGVVKKSILKIDKNKVKLISSMNHKGYTYKPLVRRPGSVSNLDNLTNHYTGDLIIDKNVASWIISSQSLGYSYNIVSDNALFAWQSSYRRKFQNADGYYPMGNLFGDNNAIVALGTSDLFASSSSNVKIIGNKLYKGELIDSLGNVTTTYTYEYSGIISTVGCEIKDNVVDFVTNTDSNGETDARIVVACNKFDVSGNIIGNSNPNGELNNGYVLVTGFTSKTLTDPIGLIVDNHFESPRTDGSTDNGTFFGTIFGRSAFGDSQDLIDRVFNRVTAERNINQSKYHIVTYNDFAYSSDLFGVEFGNSLGQDTGIGYSGNITNGGTMLDVFVNINKNVVIQNKRCLEDILPTNVKITSVAVAIYNDYGNNDDTVTINAALSKVNDTYASPYDLITYLDDVTSLRFTPPVTTANLPASNAITGTLVKNSNNLVSSNYVTNKNKNVTLTTTYTVTQNGGVNTIKVQFASPILTYRW